MLDIFYLKFPKIFNSTTFLIFEKVLVLLFLTRFLQKSSRFYLKVKNILYFNWFAFFFFLLIFDFIFIHFFFLKVLLHWDSTCPINVLKSVIFIRILSLQLNGYFSF